MKKLLFIIPICCLALFSCKKEGTLALLTNTPTAATITSPTATTLISVSRKDTLSRFLFSWTATAAAWDTVKYGKAPLTSFVLQVDTAGGQFAKNTITLTTTTSDTFSMTLGALNTILLKNFGISTTDSLTTSSLELRIVGTLAANNTPLISSVVPFQVTTWVNTLVKVVNKPLPSIYLAGNFPAGNSWAVPAVPLVSVASDQRYEGWVYFSAAGQQFKAYGVKGNWGNPSWGDSTINGTMSNILVLANYSGDNWIVPAAGLYQIGIKLDSMKNYLTPATWSILGDATPGGWNTDTQLTPDATNLIWSTTCNLTNGSFKFRVNDAWNIDYTQDPTRPNGLVHANNLWLEPYNATVGNISWATAGSYTITLNLSVPGYPTYTIK